MTVSRRALLAFGGSLLIPPRAFAMPQEIAIAPQPTYRLRIEALDIVDRYEPPFKAPYVEHHFFEPPARLAARWARTRFVVAGPGSQQTARFTIDSASVVENELPKESGLRGMFTREQDKRYDAQLAVSLELLNFGGASQGRINARVSTSHTILEKASLDDRDAIFRTMSATLVELLDQEFGKLVPQYLGAALL